MTTLNPVQHPEEFTYDQANRLTQSTVGRISLVRNTAKGTHLDFVAIDVETANPNMASICQIGLASFVDGQLVCEWHSLIDPEDYFSGSNIGVQRIEPQDVAGAPFLPDVIQVIASLLENPVAVN